MSSGETELTGPNFKEGIAKDLIPDGQKLLGHADGQPAILIREGDQFYAVGAKCTHYGADLIDGTCSHGTLHCPWHHACFDIKTGRATKAPALNPIASWRVEVQGDRVFVRDLVEEKPKELTVSETDHFVIIGSGAAGHAAAERLRELGYAGKLTVVTADLDLPYDRPNLSKDYLAGNAPEEWIPLRTKEFFAEKKIEFLLGSKVKKVDTKEKKILFWGSKPEISYTKCLIASGGTAVLPPIPGAELASVYTLRSLADCRAVIKGLSGAKKAVIIGAGFIGLEAAAALKQRGLDVQIIAPEKFPLEKAVGPMIGAFLSTLHASRGVKFHLQRKAVKIEKDGVTLDNGTKLAADIVLMAVGIRVSTDFVQGTEIKVDNGILVNEYLETDAKDVYAAGDVARWPSALAEEPVRIEHWVVAQRLGQNAAANMLGQKVKYSDVPFFWSQQYDVVINYVGRAIHFDQTKVYGDLHDRNCAVSFTENGKIKAVITVGRDQQSLEIEKLFEADDQAGIQKLLDAQ